jgi:predicted enzyme related to lactoylglutathione lyase
MKNNIQNIGWLLRRTHDTKLISNFYENVLQVPIIRKHDENLIHWCGNTTVLGFNKVSNHNNLIEDNGNFITTYKVRSITKFKELSKKKYPQLTNKKINSATLFKDPENITFGLEEVSENAPDYFDNDWINIKIKQDQSLNNDFVLSNNFLGISSFIIKSKNWEKNADFYKQYLKLDTVFKDDQRIELALDRHTLLIFMLSKIKNSYYNSRLNIRQSFVFRSLNAKVVADELQTQGHKLIEKPHTTGDQAGEIYYFNDIAGQVFGIQTRKDSKRIEDIAANKLIKK